MHKSVVGSSYRLDIHFWTSQIDRAVGIDLCTCVIRTLRSPLVCLLVNVDISYDSSYETMAMHKLSYVDLEHSDLGFIIWYKQFPVPNTSYTTAYSRLSTLPSY